MSVSSTRPQQAIEHAVVRFAGDSGDGMQLTGTEFTREAALHGNDLATFPDYPAEIRAPAGTTAGVSGYQIQFAAHEVFSLGDQPDTLVAMNPAALKVHLSDLKRGGLLIVNEASFEKGDLDRAGWKANPLTDGSLEGYRVIKVNFDKLVTQPAPKPTRPDTPSVCVDAFAVERLAGCTSGGVACALPWRATKPRFAHGATSQFRAAKPVCAPAEVASPLCPASNSRCAGVCAVSL